MRVRLRIQLIAATLLIALHAASAAAQQPAADDARAHIDKGTKLYESGAYDAALIEFRRAYELSGNYKILYNTALVCLDAKDFASALKDFQSYLQRGGSEIAAARRAEVQKEIERLGGIVAKLEIAGTEGAEVRLDDVPVGTTPLAAPLVINPGKHKVVLVKGDRESHPQLVTIGAGGAARVELRVPEKQAEKPAVAPPPAAPIAAPAPPPPKPAPPAAPVWPAWVATGALAAGTAVMGGLALSKYGALKDERRTHTSADRLSDAAGPAKTFAIVTDVLGGLTVASLGVSIYLTVRKTGASPPPASAEVRVGPGNAWITGSF